MIAVTAILALVRRCQASFSMIQCESTFDKYDSCAQQNDILIFREQGHNPHPYRHSQSGDQHHYYSHPQDSHRSSRSHNGNGNYGMTEAPPLLISRAYPLRGSCAPQSNASTEDPEHPTYPYVATDHHPQHAPHSAYGYAPNPADPSVPMPVASPAPSGAPYGTTSPQYHPAHEAPYEPPEQTRALDVPQNSRSRQRKPLVSQGMDAPDPIDRKSVV